MKAKVIFEQAESDHGQAICCTAIGYIINEFIRHYPGNQTDLCNYAKTKFIEALTFYEKIGHLYGMSFCYEMLYDIKRNQGEDAKQEYINHINLLKIIKENPDNMSLSFNERLQGVEVSLFIENIFTVDIKESKRPTEDSSIASLVQNVLEKKTIIEKLQEKMTQRLDIINNLLANHAFLGNGSSQTGANMIKNHINILGNSKLNFYNKPTKSQPFDWSSMLKKQRPSPVKAKKSFNKISATFKDKRYTSYNPTSTSRTGSVTRTIEAQMTTKMLFNMRLDNPVSDKVVVSTMYPKVIKNRRKSIDGLKMLTNHFFEPNSDDERDDSPPENVRLYFKNKFSNELNTKGSTVTSEVASPVNFG